MTPNETYVVNETARPYNEAKVLEYQEAMVEDVVERAKHEDHDHDHDHNKRTLLQPKATGPKYNNPLARFYDAIMPKVTDTAYKPKEARCDRCGDSMAKKDLKKVGKVRECVTCSIPAHDGTLTPTERARKTKLEARQARRPKASA